MDMPAVASMLGFSRSTIKKLVNDCVMPEPLIINGRRRWSRASLMQWIESGCPNLSVGAAT
jgi:predicted DNA-binding transcriptional regulator AlpA